MQSPFLKPTLIAIGAGLPFWILYRAVVVQRRAKPFSFPEEAWLLMIYMYSVGIAMITLAPFPFTRYHTPGTGINLEPYVHTAKWFMAAFSPHKRFLGGAVSLNVFGNILLFIPLGGFLAVRYRSFLKVFLLALFLSVLIEFLQFTEGRFGVYRSVDIDDVILNTFGGVLGFILSRAGFALTGRRFSKRIILET